MPCFLPRLLLTDAHRLDTRVALSLPFPSPAADGDGVVSLQEFEQNLFPKTRKKIEQKLDAGWTFDKKLWEASIARHAYD